MNDYICIDLLDEANCTNSCEAVLALCGLVDKLIADIQYLELECISTRYLLSECMDKQEGELLRMDILSHLAPRYSGNPAYETYKTLMYIGGDPMEFRDYLVKVRAACNGEMALLALKINIW